MLGPSPMVASNHPGEAGGGLWCWVERGIAAVRLGTQNGRGTGSQKGAEHASIPIAISYRPALYPDPDSNLLQSRAGCAALWRALPPPAHRLQAA